MKNEDIQIEILEYHPIALTPRPLPFVDARIQRLQQVGEFQGRYPLIFITDSALRVMETHTESNIQREAGGLVMGDFCVHGDVPFTWIEVAIPAEKAAGSPGSLRFTPEAILEIDRQRETHYPHLRPVGWYHSHPGFGIFLSGRDLDVHRTIFTEGSFVAIVLDPVHHTKGVFAWVGDDVAGPVAYWVVKAQEG